MGAQFIFTMHKVGRFVAPRQGCAEGRLAKYGAATELVWLQEEPENMDPWNAIKGRIYETHEQTHSIRLVSRFVSGSPACGSARVHAQEHAGLLHNALSF